MSGLGDRCALNICNMLTRGEPEQEPHLSGHPQSMRAGLCVSLSRQGFPHYHRAVSFRRIAGRFDSQGENLLAT